MAKSPKILVAVAVAAILLFLLTDGGIDEPPSSKPPEAGAASTATPPVPHLVQRDPTPALTARTRGEEPEAEPAGPAHTGTVVDAADRPVAGAYVTWTWQVAASTLSPEPRPRKAYVRTDENGRFRLAGAGARAAHRLYATHRERGVGLTRERDRDRDPQFDGIVIRLDPGQRIDVTVRTPAGESPKQVEVAIRYGKRDPWAPVEGLSKAYFQEPTRTTADFSLPGLSGEPFTLWLHADGFRPVRYESADIFPGPGMGIRKVQVTLEVGLVVSGTLLDKEGKPVVNATVHVNNGDRRGSRDDPFWCIHQRTNEKGRFTVGGLKDETFLIRAHIPGGTSEILAEGIRAGTTGLTLRTP